MKKSWTPPTRCALAAGLPHDDVLARRRGDPDKAVALLISPGALIAPFLSRASRRTTATSLCGAAPCLPSYSV